MAAGGSWLPLLRLDDGSVTVPQEAQMALAEAAPTPSAIALVGIDGASMARSFTGTVPPDSAASAVIWLWDQPLREAAKQRTRDAPPAVMYVEISAALRNGKQREGSDNLKLLITALLSCSLVVQPAPPTSMATQASSQWPGTTGAQGALLEEWMALGNITQLVVTRPGDTKSDQAWLASLMPELVWVLEPPSEATDIVGSASGRALSDKTLKNGKHFKTPKQRLETILGSESGFSDAKATRNRARALVSQLFPKRYAIVALKTDSRDGVCAGRDCCEKKGLTALTDFLLMQGALPKAAFSSSSFNFSRSQENDTSSSSLGTSEPSPPFSGPMMAALLREIAAACSPSVLAPSSSSSPASFRVALLPAHAVALEVLAEGAYGAAVGVWQDEVKKRLDARPRSVKREKGAEEQQQSNALPWNDITLASPLDSAQLLLEIDECCALAEEAFSSWSAGCNGVEWPVLERFRSHVATGNAMLVAANHEASEEICTSAAKATVASIKATMDSAASAVAKRRRDFKNEEVEEEEEGEEEDGEQQSLSAEPGPAFDMSKFSTRIRSQEARVEALRRASEGLPRAYEGYTDSRKSGVVATPAGPCKWPSLCDEVARELIPDAAVAPLSTAASEFQAARRALKDRIKDEIEAAGVMTQEVGDVEARRGADRAKQMAEVGELLARGERARAAVEAEVHTLEMEVSEVSSRAARLDVLKRKKVTTALGRIEQAKQRSGVLGAKVCFCDRNETSLSLFFRSSRSSQHCHCRHTARSRSITCLMRLG